MRVGFCGFYLAFSVPVWLILCVRPCVRPGSKNGTYYPGYLLTLVRRGAVIETEVEETHVQIFIGFFLHALFILQGRYQLSPYIIKEREKRDHEFAPTESRVK